jgi:hypothetical protein
LRQENKRRGGRRQARPISLSPLATGSPDIGVPTLSISLSAASLEISSPEVKPSAKRVHHLESGDSTIKRKPRGRRPRLTAEQKAQLQTTAREWLSDDPKRNEKEAIAYMMKHLDGIKVSRFIIERQIVRPVYKKLKAKND